ncbi:MAG TPA: UbiA family prenyltransferase [Candidatus Portnoybacteria bacterium]|nr:UbiA family prenyltransferase [Candidatus Portnoybacteria bacterium]
MTLREIINQAINREISWPKSLATVFSIIFLRIFLENFSSTGPQSSFTLISGVFLHIPLFYISIIASLFLAILFFAKLEIKQAINLGVLFSPIMCLPPIVDLIFTGGAGANTAYLFFNNFREAFFDFLTFFGKFVDPGITLGMRIEIFLVLAGVAYLIYLKTRNIKRTILGAFFCYIVFFIYLAFPGFIVVLFDHSNYLALNQDGGSSAFSLVLSSLFSGSLLKTIHFSEVLSSNRAVLFNQQFDILCSRILWLVLLFQGGLIFYLKNKQSFFPWLNNLRWERVLYYLALSVLGMFLGLSLYLFGYSFGFIDFLGLLIFFVLVALSFWLAVGINDQADLKTDSISNPDRPLVKKTITDKEQNAINLFLFVAIIIGSLLINCWVLILLLLFQGVYFIYSSPPFRLKQAFGLSSLLVGLNALVITMAGFYFVSPQQSLINFPKNVLIMLLFGFTLGVNIKDIKDYEGDKADNINTIPVVFGLLWGKRIIAALAFLALLAVALLTSLKGIMVASLIFSIIFFLLINRRDYEEKSIFGAFFIYITICIISLITR